MTPLEYARVAIDIPPGADARKIWQQLGSLDGQIAVNLVDGSGQSAMLTEALVEDVRAAASRVVSVDALPERRYRELASAKIDQAINGVTTLRAAWRTRPIGDTAIELQTLLQRLTEIALLVSVFAHQRLKPSLLTVARRLPSLGAQLAESSFQLDDTVRASDDVHYEILPVLRQLQPLLSPIDQ